MTKARLLKIKRKNYRQEQCFYCRCVFNWENPSSDFYPTRDHKLPKSKGGTNDPRNIVLACRPCNTEKADMTVAEFREYLEVTKGIRGQVMRQITWQKHKGTFKPAYPTISQNRVGD